MSCWYQTTYCSTDVCAAILDVTKLDNLHPSAALAGTVFFGRGGGLASQQSLLLMNDDLCDVPGVMLEAVQESLEQSVVRLFHTGSGQVLNEAEDPVPFERLSRTSASRKLITLTEPVLKHLPNFSGGVVIVDCLKGLMRYVFAEEADGADGVLLLDHSDLKVGPDLRRFDRGFGQLGSSVQMPGSRLVLSLLYAAGGGLGVLHDFTPKKGPLVL